jgi:hypothetical protein
MEVHCLLVVGNDFLGSLCVLMSCFLVSSLFTGPRLKTNPPLPRAFLSTKTLPFRTSSKPPSSDEPALLALLTRLGSRSMSRQAILSTLLWASRYAAIDNVSSALTTLVFSSEMRIVPNTGDRRPLRFVIARTTASKHFGSQGMMS